MLTVKERTVTIGLYGNPGEITAVSDKLAFPHPHKDRIPSYQIFRHTNGEQGWDGKIRPLKKVSPGEADALRGHKSRILNAMKELGIGVNQDSRILESPFSDITLDDVPDDVIQSDFQLDESQRSAIAHWLREGMGIARIAVNGGKTAAFAGFVGMLKASNDDFRAVYITDRERLVTQAHKEMRKFLPDLDVTKFGGGSDGFNGKDVVICTLAMLRRNLSELRKVGWFKSFHAVLFDECHHAASETAGVILEQFSSAYFRASASDTIKEEDPLKHNLITGYCGPVLMTVKQQTLIDQDRSAVPHIYLIDPPKWRHSKLGVPYRPEPGSKAWVLLEGEATMTKARYVGPVYEYNSKGEVISKKKSVVVKGKIEKIDAPVARQGCHTLHIEGLGNYEVNSSFCLLDRSTDKCIVNNKERNNLIAEWVRYFADEQGKRTLVVATRTIHVLLLEATIRALGVIGDDKIRTLVGEDSSRQRDKTFDWFKSTPGSVLITPLVKEGVSVNEIEAGVVADYVGDWEYANQIIGRFIRKKDGDNVAEIAWFIDRHQKRYEKGCLGMFSKLKSVKGYVYYWPVVTPSDLANVEPSDTTAVLESKARQVEMFAK